MIYIAVCDDNKVITHDLKEKIQFSKASYGLEINISIYDNTKDIIDSLEEIKFDIVFMDVNWNNKKITGLELADKIKRKLPDCYIIYISSFDSYYSKMVNHEPFRFLHKPINKDELCSVLSSVYDRIKNDNDYYIFTHNRVLEIIKFKDIKYVYSQHRKLIIVMSDNENYMVYKKLDDFEEEIKLKNKYFVRIGKSYLINFLNVMRVHKDCVEFNDGEKLFYSKKYAKEALQKIAELSLK